MKNYLLLIIAMFIMGTTFGQLSGIKNIPGSGGENDYATIAAAITALNSGGVGAGGVTFNVAAGYTETLSSPTAGLITTTGTVNNPIIFQKSGVGANPVVTAGIGTGTTDGIIKIAGGDYITFDAINLAENAANLTATTQMEWGYALVKGSATAPFNGCQYVTIKNCGISLNKTNTLAIGIYSGNHIATLTTALTITAATDAVNNCKLYGNTISNCYGAIAMSGFSGSATLYDQNNEIGVTTSNTISNMGASTSSVRCIYAIYQNGLKVAENNISSNASGATTTVYGIFLSTATSSNVHVYNNTISFSFTTGTYTSTIYGINNAMGATAASNVVNIYNNTIQNCNLSSITTGGFQAIVNTGTAATVNIYGNTIASNVLAGTGDFYGIYNNASMSTNNLNIYSNTIRGNKKTGASGTMYLSRAVTATIVYHSNNIYSDTATGSSAIYGYYNSSSPVTESYYSNSIHDLFQSGTGTIYGIQISTTAGVKNTYSNTIYNFTAASGVVYGIGTGYGAPHNIYKNSIYNLSGGGTGGTVHGLYISGGTTMNVYNNFVSDLRTPAATATNSINGIYFGGGTNVAAYYNTVYLNASSTSATSFGSTGIYKSSTSVGDFRNNLIVNTSTPGPTGGLTVAYRWSGAYSAANYSTLSNNNNFYAGTPSAFRLIFYDGTNSDQTIQAFQSRVTPRDVLSFSELPPFVNVASTPYDLHISTALPLTATKCESGGTIVSTPLALTDDFDGNARYDNSGYPNDPGYPASNPDVGADEFAGKPLFTCAQPVVGNTVASANAICLGQSITLSLQYPTAGTGLTYRWQSSADGITYNNINGAVLSTYTVSPLEPIYFQCIVACNNEPLTSDTSVPVQITFANTVSSTTPASRCGTGTVDLEATTSTGSISWYAAASGGTSVGSGSPWTTPSISTTTTYYAGAETPATISAGRTTPAGTSSDYWTGYGLVFTASSDFILYSVKVYPVNTAPANMTIKLLNSSGVQVPGTSDVIFMPISGTGSTAQTVTLNYTVPAGTGYRLVIAAGMGTTNKLVQETTGYTYPIVSGPVSVTSNWNGSSTSTSYYDWFYDWSVSGVCSSPRVGVTATVNPPPAITPSATPLTICQGESSDLDVTSENDPNYTYVWTPGDLNGASQSVSPSATQTYLVTATDNSTGTNAGCVTTGNVTITVNPLPSDITITPSAATLPAGTTQMLTASIGGTGTIGTGTVSNTTNTPYKGYFGGIKSQYLFTSGELTAMGLTSAVPISKLSFFIAAFTSPYTFNGFTIAMKNTTTSVLTSTLETGVTTVLAPSDYVLSGTAPFTITHILTTPFTWDGSSNLLIETCFNNNNGGGVTGNSADVKSTTMASNLAAYYSADNTATVCSAPGAATTSLVRPNIGFDFSEIPAFTWLPTTYLYTNAEATTGYNGENLASVYTKPLATTTYTVTATSAAGCINTNTVLVTSCPPAPGSPATSNIAATSFDLNWSSSQGSHVDPLTYTIEVATENTFTAPIFGTYQTTDPVVTKSITGLTANTRYYYRIKAAGDCDSPWTTTASEVTCPGTPGTPSTASISASSFILNWTAPAGGSAQPITYSVDIATDPDFTIGLTTVSTSNLTYTFNSLTGNTKYYYRVKSTNGTCPDNYTAVGNVATCPVAPGSPSTSDITSTSFSLNWSSSQGSQVTPITYTIEVATENTFTAPIFGTYQTTDPVVTKSITGLTANTRYYYRIKANGDCESTWTTTASVVTCPGTPGTPSTASITASSFILNWTAPAGGSAQPITYSVDIATNSAFTAGLTTVSTSNLTYTFSSLTGNTKYYYRVKSTNGTCPDNYTAVGNVITCPAAPVLSTPVLTSSTAQLNWLSSAGGSGTTLNYTIDAGTNINFLVGLLPGSPFTVADPTTTLALNTLQANTTYYYRIKAIGAGTCNSSFSTVGTVVTCPGTPVGLAASNLASTSFDLSWTAASGGTSSAIQYTIDVTTDPGFSTPVAGSPFTLNHPVVSLHIGGLTGNTPYYYRVKATGSCASNYVDGMTTTLACFEPVGLSAVSTSSSTVYISWSAPSIAPPFGYEYEVYTTIGNTLVASGIVNPGLFVSLTGLTAMTSYSVKLRSVCDGGTYSQWENTTVTTTNCSVASIPYLETFDTYTPPNYGCLTVEDVNQDVITWYTSSGPSHSGTKKMTILTSDPPEVMNDWLFTKGLSLEAGRSYKVNFWYRAVSSSFAEKMEVKWGYGPISGLMTSTAIFTNTGFSNAAYTLGTATFTVPTTGAFWIGWHCFSDPQKAGIYLDDISVCELPDVAGTISGPVLVCKPQTNQSYSVPPIQDATSYVWSVPSGASIIGAANTNTILVDYPSGSVSGDVTVYGVNDCGIGVTSTLAIDIYPQMPASVSISGTFSTVCEGESIDFTAVPVNGGENPSYEWKVNGQTLGSGSNTLTYTPFDNDVVECILTSDYICAITNPATSNELTITVIPQLVVGSVSSDQTICENHVPELLVAVDPLTGNTPSYQWQVSADGETFSDISGATEKDYQPGNLSVTTWYRQLQNALVTCSGPLPTNAVKITVIPTVGTPTAITIADGMDPVCQLTNGTTTTTYATTATTNTGFNWTLSDNNAGTITSAGVMTWADGYAGVVDIQVTANGCNGPSAMVTYQVDITPTVGLPTAIVVSAGTEPSCQLINETTTTTYSTTATNNTGFNWTISNPLAGSINPSSGVMTWTNGFFGSVDIQVTADGCNGPSGQTIRNVVVTETVGTPVFADGASSVRCQGAGNVLYAAMATTTTGITYSLDLVSSGAGVIINQNTGEVTYTAAWSGTTVITASAAGCNGPALATHSATTTETVGTPTTITIAAGTEPVCHIINETTTTTYATTATTNTGFNWSLSNNAAGNINSSGVMTWMNGFSGTVDIQVTANGCNGPSAQTIRTVTITPTVGTPTAITILAGVDPACQLINETTTTTYATTVTNGTGFNWTISNPLAGNIGAATGIMSWANGFTGSVDIQVTANGCNGPSAMISHSVTVNPTVGLPAAITVADGVDPACQLTNGTTTTTYATTASNSTSYTWSLSNPAAGIIGASTGVMTWADGFAGTVDIQVVAQGCNGPSAMTVRTVVVNPNLPVSVSIERSTNNVCAGTLVTFTATAVNPGDSPVYQWKRNGVNIGANNTMFTFAPANEDVITCELTSNAICATGSPAISNSLTMSINPVLPVSISVTAGSNPSCAGNQVTFTALAVNGGLTPVYQWRVNGSVVGTDSDTYTYLPVTGDVVRCMVTSSETCVSGNPATSAPLTMTVNPMLPVSVSIVTSANNVCAGTQVTLTATPVNGGTLPAYQWFVNSVDVAGATNATYSYAPSNTDLVTCVLTSSILCGSNNPATSNTVTMVVNPISPVSITIAPSANPSCAGSSVTFTATPVNGGSSPAYQWRVNDIRRGTNSPVYTYVPANNDVVTCRLTSNQVCATGSPATSNAVAMTVSQYAPASVSIATTSETVCVGEQVTLTATPVNGGTSPSYQWKLGSGNINGATNATYTYTPANNDAISCIMTSNYACATGNPATSNTIVITVNPLLPVSVSVLASENPSAIGNPVTFTATGVNEGSAPVYQWFVNGTEAGLNSNTYVYTPSDGDMIYCIMTSNDACISGNPATSNTINMTVVPEMVSLNDIIVHNLETVCYNAANTITVAGNNTTFQVENGGSATMIAGQKIVFLEGTIVYPGGYLHGYISNQFCGSMPAPIMAVVAGKDENPVAVDYPAFKIYPNPTSGNFTLEQKGNFDYPNVKVEVYGMRGERILTEEIIGQMRHEFVFSNVPAGLYFVKIITGDYIETIKLVKSR